MNTIQGITSSYKRLLSLYPADFQAEFGEEMAEVFARTLKDSRCNGLLAFIHVCLRELGDFPKNLLQEYARKMEKRFSQGMSPLAFNPFSTALLGALGFGLGFALLILLRAWIDPGNHTILANFGLTWLRETLLFMLIGALGGAFIGSGSHSLPVLRRFALAGTLSCGLAGSLGTLVLYLYYRFGMAGDLDKAPLLNELMVGLSSIFIGALMGAALGIAQGNWQRIARQAWAGAFGFGVADLTAQITFDFAQQLWTKTTLAELWMIPLAFSTLILGVIGGAVLGWTLGQKTDSSPTQIVEQ